MTGLEIIACLNGKARLFKVRHDGYAVEDYVAKFQVPTAKTLQEAIEHFKNWFFDASNYGPEDPSVDVETNFSLGYEFTPSNAAFQEMVSQACDELETMGASGTLTLDEGLTCGYDDYTLLIDLDNGQFIINDGESLSEDNQNPEKLQQFIEENQLLPTQLPPIQKLSSDLIGGIIAGISYVPHNTVVLASTRQFGAGGMHLRVYDCDGEEWQVLSCPKDEKIISISGEGGTFSDPSGTNFGLNKPVQQLQAHTQEDCENCDGCDDEFEMSDNPADYVFSISEAPLPGYTVGNISAHLITIVESTFFTANGYIQDQPMNELLSNLPTYIEEVNETSTNALHLPPGKTVQDIVAELEQLGMTYSNDLAKFMENETSDKHYIK
jgi:hypothetical protein